MFELIQKVPDVIWSGVIASILTLSGVLISNRSNTKRLLLQLDHDSTQKSVDRSATMRREVYLQAAAELAKANSHLANLSDIDPSVENPADGLEGFYGAAAKLGLVAEPKTALLVNQLVAAYTSAFVRLMAFARPVYEVNSRIALLNGMYDAAYAGVTRVLAEMRKLNESGQADTVVFSALERSFKFQRDCQDKHASDRNDAWQEYNGLNRAFMRQLLVEMNALRDQQVRVLVSIRHDLGLTTDLEEYRKQIETQWRTMSAQLEDMFPEDNHALPRPIKANTA